MKFKNAPLTYIWEILHERGLYNLVTAANPNPEPYKVEKQAWDFAEREIKSKYPLLEEMIEDFYKHRDDKLASYL